MAAPYAGSPVTIKLPVPLDPATLDVWAGQLDRQAFAPLQASINSIIRYLNGDATPPVPIVAPTVAIGVPATGAIVQGGLTVTARANGVTAISSMVAFLGTNRLGPLNPTNSGTYVLPAIDSNRYPDGPYLLSVQAIDSLGNTGVDTVTVQLANTVTTAPQGDFLVTETGDQLTTETGDQILLGTTPDATSDYTITTETSDPLATESGDTLVQQ